MRITDITNKFVDQIPCRGVYMKAEWVDDVMTLSHNYGDNSPIAEIYDYKDPKNFRLRLHPHTGRSYNSQSHKNRVDSVLWSIQAEDKSKRWGSRRYHAYIRSAVKLWDSNLEVEYHLQKPMEFVLTDGRLTLDYRQLESNAYPDGTPTPTPDVEPNTNSNLQSVNSKLTAILAGV